jgi:hypothetical protein
MNARGLIAMRKERNSQQDDSPSDNKRRWEFSPRAGKIFTFTYVSVISLIAWVFLFKVPFLIALAITGAGVGAAILFIYRFTNLW